MHWENVGRDGTGRVCQWAELTGYPAEHSFGCELWAFDCQRFHQETLIQP